MERILIARGYGESVNTGYNTFELYDFGSQGFRYTPAGHIPKADDRRYRFVIFRNSITHNLSDSLGEIMHYLEGVSTRGDIQYFGDYRA